MVHPTVALPHPTRSLLSRGRLASCVALALVGIAGCATPVSLDSRTDLLSFHASQRVRVVPIALIDFSFPSAEPGQNDEELILSYPDEKAVKHDDVWTITVNPLVVRPTSIFMHSLKYAGINIESYPTMSAAKKAGRRVALVGTVKTAEVTIHSKSLGEQLVHVSRAILGKVEAVIEIYLAIVDLNTLEVLWAGPLKSTVKDIIETPYQLDALAVLVPSSALGELTLHPSRVVLAQAYFNAAMGLVSQLEETVARKLVP